MKANTTMASTMIVSKLARMPLLVLFHDTFEAFLLITKNNAPLNEPNKLAEAATRSNNVTDSKPATSRMWGSGTGQLVCRKF